MTDPGSGTAGPGSDPSAIRRMWLQRWVTTGELTPSQADAIEQSDQASGDATFEDATGYDRLRLWIDRWTGAGLVTAVQAARIRDDVERAATPPVGPPVTVPVSPSGAPPEGSGAVAAPLTAAAPVTPAGGGLNMAVVVELLGYVGAALATTASIWLMRNVWNDFAPGVQLAIVGSIAVLLTAATYLIRVDDVPAFNRLRAVVGLAASAVFGAVGAVVALQFLETRYPATVAFTVCGFIMVHSAVLWLGRKRPVQQVVALVGLISTTWIGMYLLEQANGPSVIRRFGNDYYSDTETIVSAWRGYTGWALLGLGVLLVALGFVRPVRIALITTIAGLTAMLFSWIPIWQCYLSVGISITIVCLVTVLVVALQKPIELSAAQRGVFGGSALLGGVWVLVVTPVAMEQIPYHGVHWTSVGTVLAICGVGVLALSAFDKLLVPELADIGGAFGAIAGLCAIGVAFDWLTPILGIAGAAVLLVLGYQMRRVSQQVMGWIALAIFAVWELVWVGRQVNVAAVVILGVGALLVAIAVFLNRRIHRANVREAASAAPEATDDTGVR